MREKLGRSAQSFLKKLCFGAIISSILIGMFLATANISAVHDDVSIKVDVSCSISAANGGDGYYSVSIMPGTSSEVVGTPINASCDDANGYDLYAIGYSNDNYTVRNTELISALDEDYNIQTATSGDDSYWAMKVAGSGTLLWALPQRKPWFIIIFVPLRLAPYAMTRLLRARKLTFVCPGGAYRLRLKLLPLWSN